MNAPPMKTPKSLGQNQPWCCDMNCHCHLTWVSFLVNVAKHTLSNVTIFDVNQVKIRNLSHTIWIGVRILCYFIGKRSTFRYVSRKKF